MKILPSISRFIILRMPLLAPSATISQSVSR